MPDPTPREINEFHKHDDVDSHAFAHHHTLGDKPNQASPGTHGHDPSSGTVAKPKLDRLVVSVVTGTYTLSYTPIIEGEEQDSLIVSLNGIVQDRDTDFTISGRSLTILAAMDASVGDVLICYYWYSPVEVVPLYAFQETYNRSDREIIGDNGWYETYFHPSTGQQSIIGGRLRPLTTTTGFPGSSGTIGTPVCHATTPSDPDIFDETIEIASGTLSASSGWIYIIGACTQNAASPPVIESGFLIRWLVRGINNILIQKITATNSTTDHSPGTFDELGSNVTTTVRLKLVRSTGVLQMWLNGVLKYTSAGGDFSGLTGSIIGFQFSTAYSTTPVEIESVNVA